MKNWSWFIIAQRELGEPPDKSDVEIVVADITETDAVVIVEAELLLIAGLYTAQL